MENHKNRMQREASFLGLVFEDYFENGDLTFGELIRKREKEDGAGTREIVAKAYVAHLRCHNPVLAGLLGRALEPPAEKEEQ